MFTVHFNKVRQIASNVLSFDLLPKQSIDDRILGETRLQTQTLFL